MPPAELRSLWSALGAAGHRPDRALHGLTAGVALADLVHGSSLGGRRADLRGRSVLVATRDQLTAALALIELDGIATRLILCPPDLPAEHRAFVTTTGEVEAVVSDGEWPATAAASARALVTCRPDLVADAGDREPRHRTEWVLLTSGTTGPPKLVAHTLASLIGAIKPGSPAANRDVWSTFYDIRRYGGLQIFLRAVLGGGSLVLSSADESANDFLVRAGGLGVTHISGTPSHWRRALMSPFVHKLTPRYARLSGEIADQAILDHLRGAFPDAGIGHAFASTEAGVAFDVNDGLSGFPAGFVGAPGDVELKVQDGSLRIRSPRIAMRYLGHQAGPLADAEGFVDTGDMVERRGDRFYFVGRRDGIINVGGLKVHPEEVEAVINGHPSVSMSIVRTRKSPITGALVVADVLLRTDAPPADAARAALERELLERCRERLARHKVPAAITFVPALAVAASGKVLRRRA